MCKKPAVTSDKTCIYCNDKDTNPSDQEDCPVCGKRSSKKPKIHENKFACSICRDKKYIGETPCPKCNQTQQ